MSERRTVLVVDDNRLIRTMLSDALGGELDVRCAADGAEAQQVLSETRIDLVLTDLNMPKVDGFELIATLVRERPRLPVVVMTSLPASSIDKAIIPGRVLRILRKPLDLPRVTAYLRSILQDSMGGHLVGVSLASLLQVLHLERKTCTVRVTAGTKTGSLQLVRGELFDAECAGQTGLAAAYEVLPWDQPHIEILTGALVARTIQASLTQVLLDAMRQSDERRRDALAESKASLRAANVPPSAAARDAEAEVAGLEEWHDGGRNAEEDAALAALGAHDAPSFEPARPPARKGEATKAPTAISPAPPPPPLLLGVSTLPPGAARPAGAPSSPQSPVERRAWPRTPMFPVAPSVEGAATPAQGASPTDKTASAPSPRLDELPPIIAETLTRAVRALGAMSAAIFDLETGKRLRESSAPRDERDGAPTEEPAGVLLRAAVKLARAEQSKPEEIVITASDHCHLLRPMTALPGLCVHLVLRRRPEALVMARSLLARLDAELKPPKPGERPTEGPAPLPALAPTES